MTGLSKTPKYIWEIVLWRHGLPVVYGRLFANQDAKEALKDMKKAFNEWDPELKAEIHDKSAGWEIRKRELGIDPYAAYLIQQMKEKE